MDLVLTIVCGLVIIYWIFCNAVVTVTMSTEEMYEDLVTEQNWLGKILGNSFYCLAWFLKFCLKRVDIQSPLWYYNYRDEARQREECGCELPM